MVISSTRDGASVMTASAKKFASAIRCAAKARIADILLLAPPCRHRTDAQQPAAHRLAGECQEGRGPGQAVLHVGLLEPVDRLAHRVETVLQPVSQRRQVRMRGGGAGLDRLDDVRKQLIEGGASVHVQLAADQVDRLDGVRALVDRRDPRIAQMLGRAGFLDITHAAMHLDTQRGDFDPDIGRPGLGDRREQFLAPLGGRLLVGVLGMFGHVRRHRT